MNGKRARPWFQTILVFLLLLVSFREIEASPNPAEASTRPRLHIGYLAAISHLPLIMAFERDRYNLQHGSVRLYRYQTSTGLEAALRVGGIDLAVLPGPIVLAMAQDQVPIRVLAFLFRGGSRLYQRTRGTDEKTFRGLTIGVPGLDSMEHVELIRFLNSQNLQYGIDYKVFGVEMGSALSAVRMGTVDAFFLPEPLPFLATTSLTGVSGAIVPIAGQAEFAIAMLVARSELEAPEMQPLLGEWLEALQRATGALAEDMANGTVEQAAITSAAYLALPPATVSSLLAAGGQYVRFGYEKVSREDLGRVAEGMALIGLPVPDEQTIEQLLDEPQEMVKTLSPQGGQ